MQNLRLFWAVSLPDQVKKQLGMLMDLMKKGRADAKWVEKDNLHLTIKFLGELPANQLPLLIGTVREAVSGTGSFNLMVKGLGFFPSAQRPRILWAGLTGELDRLREVHHLVEDSLAPLGWPPENRRFSPHLTLARLRSHKGVETLTRLVPELANRCAVDMPVPVEELKLMESKLMRQGPLYTILDRIIL